MADVAEVIQAMSDPAFYPHDPETVELRESTTSVVFLAGERAYKLKKPINHPDMNYSTPARRRRMCNLEVELTRRLSPNLYQGVQKITTRRPGFALNGRGKVVDYVIQMKRLGDENNLRRLVVTEDVQDDDVRRLARKLSVFHEDAERRQLIDTFSRPHIMARQWNRRLRATAEYVGTIFSAEAYRDIVTFASYFLSENRSLFQTRIDHGYVCDGHGELSAEHIYLENGIQVIDCVEYNDRMRFRDVAFDLAALVLSFDALGATDLSDILIEEYKAASGIALQPVIEFYLCFRAHDRALTLSRLANMPEVPLAEHQALVRRARRYYHLAHRYSRGDRQPILLIMSGVIGVGKTRLASALSEILSIRYLAAEDAQEQFAKVEEGADPASNADAARVDKAYADLFTLAEQRLERGGSVVLDAPFHNSTYRVAARSLARKYDAEFLVVECDADEDILRERVREQAQDKDERPRERLRLLREQQKAFSPSREIYRKDKIYVNTTDSLDEQVQTVMAELMAILYIRDEQRDVEEWRPGVRTRMYVSAATGSSQLVVFEQWCDPGHGAPPHIHAVEEVLRVLAGAARIEVSGDDALVHPGETVIIPAGHPHSFTNTGSTTLHTQAILAAPIFEAEYLETSQTTRRWRPEFH